MAIAVVAAQQRDRWQGVFPHAVPHCSPTGGEKSARCRCPGMVGEVQDARIAECWREAGFLIADDAEQRRKILRVLSAGTPSRQVLKCLGDVPDHCQVIAEPAHAWGYEGKNTCRTSCKPERCGCADSACKSHADRDY